MRLAHRERHGDAKCDAEGRAGRTANHHDDEEDQDVSTVHEDREAFALLDEVIDAVFAIAHDDHTDQNAVPVDAVLIVGAQRVDDRGARVEHVAVFPRAGTQPARTRALVAEAGKLLDEAEHDDMCAHCGHALAYLYGHNGKVLTHWHAAVPCPDGSGNTACLPTDSRDDVNTTMAADVHTATLRTNTLAPAPAPARHTATQGE